MGKGKKTRKKKAIKKKTRKEIRKKIPKIKLRKKKDNYSINLEVNT